MTLGLTTINDGLRRFIIILINIIVIIIIEVVENESNKRINAIWIGLGGTLTIVYDKKLLLLLLLLFFHIDFVIYKLYHLNEILHDV